MKRLLVILDGAASLPALDVLCSDGARILVVHSEHALEDSEVTCSPWSALEVLA